ncbi:unnamed protein product [Brassica oleracea var. botrytis]
MVNPQLFLPELKAGRSNETVVKIQERGRAYTDDISLVDEQCSERVETELSGFDVKGVIILSRTPHHMCLLDSANIWSRKLQRGFSSITCASCNNNNTVGVLSSGAATNRYWWLGGWSNDAIDWRLRVTWSGLHVQVLAPGDGGYSRSVVVGFFSGGGGLLRSTVADSSFREGETHTAPPSPAFGHGEWRLAKLRAAVFGFLSLISAFFLVVVINGSGGDLVFAIDLSDDRISVLKAAAVEMIWSCRARVVPVDRSMDVSPGVSGLWGSRCGSSRWLTGTTVTLR